MNYRAGVKEWPYRRPDARRWRHMKMKGILNRINTRRVNVGAERTTTNAVSWCWLSVVNTHSLSVACAFHHKALDLVRSRKRNPMKLICISYVCRYFAITESYTAQYESMRHHSFFKIAVSAHLVCILSHLRSNIREMILFWNIWIPL